MANFISKSRLFYIKVTVAKYLLPVKNISYQMLAASLLCVSADPAVTLLSFMAQGSVCYEI